jgi:TonB family protein
MLVGTQQRKKRNSAKVNLVISACFHGALVAVVLYFAAHEGWLGKQAQYLTVIIEQPKPPEKPKELPKPKVEEAKVDAPKPADVPKPPPIVETHAPPPPASDVAAAVAPPPAEAPAFYFDGGKEVKEGSPVQVYKELLENALRLNWDRPSDMDDHTNLAEVKITVDKTGKIINADFTKKSGQKAWDDSVQRAVAGTKVPKAPPTNFPSSVLVQFDMQAVEPAAQ